MMQISGKNILNRLHKITPTISVGVLTADLLSLGRDLALLEKASVKLVHIDVMDGCFTPKMTFGPPLIKAMKTSLLKDVHLMIENPLETIGDYVASGADMITVHLESSRHIHRVLQALDTMNNVNDPERGLVQGIALNPGTDVELIQPIIDEVNMILLLAVNPAKTGLPLQNEVALVTGAAGAIGSGICKRLLEKGCCVAATDLPGENLDGLVNELKETAADRIIGIGLDVADRDSVADGFNEASRVWGGVDIVIVNAGIPLIASLMEIDLDDFRRLEKVNVEGTLLTLSEAGYHLCC